MQISWQKYSQKGIFVENVSIPDGRASTFTQSSEKIPRNRSLAGVNWHHSINVTEPFWSIPAEDLSLDVIWPITTKQWCWIFRIRSVNPWINSSNEYIWQHCDPFAHVPQGGERAKINWTNCLPWIIHSTLAPSNTEIQKHWKTALQIVSIHSEWPLLLCDSLCSVLNVLNLSRFLFFLRLTDFQCITHILLIHFINYLRYLFDKCYLFPKKKYKSLWTHILGLVLTELQFLAFQSEW